MFGYTSSAQQDYIPLRSMPAMPGMPGMPQQQTFQQAAAKMSVQDNPLIVKKKVGYLLVCEFIL